VLSGDGGDEVWGGYPTYRAHSFAKYFAYLPESWRKGWISKLAELPRPKFGYQSWEWKLKRFILRWDNNPYLRHLRWMSSIDIEPLKKLFGNGFNFPRAFKEWESVNSPQSLNQMMAFDFRTYLSESVLTKVDRASMASSLEVRPPLLDSDLVEWAFSLPEKYKIRGNQGKYLLKKVALGKIPYEIIYRKKKGFGIPLAQWLNGPLLPQVRKVFHESPLWEKGALKRDVFLKWQIDHLNRQEDQSRPLWALLVLDHWMRKEGVNAFTK
jgi:asparagine synthase (glutamine-hydrolysing)